jgi:hypothetical protein
MHAERWRSETLAREAGADPARDGAEKAARIEPAVDGHQAARRLRDLMPRPSASYLAVVVEDLDGMGLFLSGRAAAASGLKISIMSNEHGRVSRDLPRLSRWQTDALTAPELLSSPSRLSHL